MPSARGSTSSHADRARAPSDPPHPAEALRPAHPSEQMARALGNQAMGRVLGAEVAPRGHPDEAAADALAHAVMTTPAPATPRSSVPDGLDASTRAYFEPRFCVDLTHVRVRTDPEAAAHLDAAAYTLGSVVTFGAGHRAGPDPLTAHELAHVVRGDAVGRVCRAPQPPRYPPPQAGHTPFTFISEGPALPNWQASVVAVLEREFKEKFASYGDAVRRFRERLAAMPDRAAAEDFADRMRDRVRKDFYRREYREPSYTYDADQTARLKGGRSPNETSQLEHLQEVKTKTRGGRVIEGRPELALDPGNVYITEGGPRGTAPRGSLHAEKDRTIRQATERSEEIRRATSPEGGATPHPAERPPAPAPTVHEPPVHAPHEPRLPHEPHIPHGPKSPKIRGGLLVGIVIAGATFFFTDSAYAAGQSLNPAAYTTDAIVEGNTSVFGIAGGVVKDLVSLTPPGAISLLVWEIVQPRGEFRYDPELAERAIREGRNPFCAQCHGPGGALDPANAWNRRALEPIRLRTIPWTHTDPADRAAILKFIGLPPPTATVR